MLIRVYIGVSADGFVATADGNPAWGDRFDPVAYGHDEFLQQIGAVVMGRTTFDQAAVTFVGDWPWKGKEVYVLTSRPLPTDPPAGVTAWQGGAAALLAHLRAAHLARDVELLGGPRTIQAFRELGGIDRLEIYLLPALLGDGIPLFPPRAAPLALRLDRHRTFPDGTIELIYSPA
ncbi:MAG: dihydrofolate reductase family protein [Gemmatimonadales bacterium]